MLESVYEIFKHTCRLRDIVSQQILDYSALQPLAKQVAAHSANLPVQLASLKTSATGLRNITSLATGLGINQIWSTFFENKLTTDEVGRLEELVVNIGSSGMCVTSSAEKRI